ncbi:MAG: hypothetical protein HFI68_00720 [Lachnospiraceae bacterium]|nr:hypothetical protein [Lachnospiraceae bacterium]
MASSVFKQAADILRRRKKNKRWLAVFFCIAFVAAVGIIALLKPTGKAMTHEEKILSCQYTIHEHTESCYVTGESGEELICGYADYAVHTHDGSCYGSDGSLVCKLPEMELHVHDGNCYEEEWILTCGVEAGAGGHEHTDDCYGEEEKPLICGLEENEEHTHGESCYGEGERPLVCGMEAGAGGHEHVEACYQVEKRLVCGKTETQLHTHDAACYGTDENGNEILTCGLLQVEEHIHGEDCFTTVDVAGEEQESVDETAADGEQETVGETEETTEIPVYICGLEEHIHGEDCYDEAGELTCKVEEHTHGENCLAEPETEEIITQSWENENYVITAAYTKAANLPENAALQVEEITEEEDPEEYARRGDEAQKILEGDKRLKCLFEIGFYADGVEVEPQDTVKVTIQFLNEEGYAEGDPITIVHFAEDKIEVLPGTQIDGEGAASFDAKSFSPYAVFTNGDGTVDNFRDLRDRLEKAADGDTITLTKDIEVRTSMDKSEPGWYDPLAKRVHDKYDYLHIFIDSGNKVRLDLNGHKINVYSDKTLVQLMNGSELEIIDSQPANDVRPSDGENWDGQYGWKGFGQHNADGSWTYHEIYSAKNGTGTSESVYTHTVTGGGRIIRNQQSANSLIYVAGGTFTLSGGTIDGQQLGRAISSAFYNTNKLNFNGGYICNCKSVANWKKEDLGGGAVYDDCGAEINLGGTVIANNRTDGTAGRADMGNGGAIAMVKGGRLNITGGMVTGNQSSVYGKGGGIYVDKGVTVNLSGNDAIICNNKDEMQNANALTTPGKTGDRTVEYAMYDGGGGILIGSGCVLNMSGGQINGNTASGGGGIQTTEAGSTLNITGGHVSRNLAKYHEGGGIVVVGGKGTALVKSGGTKVYITNNKTETIHDWGGGGIFCVESAHLTIQGALITDNWAEGYGGGVGGCSNAQVVNSVTPMTLDLGTAVYDNTAEGEKTAENPWYKATMTQDREFAVYDDVFQQMVEKADQSKVKGYNDFYCEQYSTVSNLMLGGGYSNWIGSANDLTDVSGQANGSKNSTAIKFKRDQGDARSSSNRMGLTADPTEASRNKALDSATVFISGNYSTTHGGGVQCNGILLLGDSKQNTFGDILQLKATKQLLDADGNKTTLADQQFSFGIYEYDKAKDEIGDQVGNLVKNNDKGEICFEPISIFGSDPKGNTIQTYLVREISDGASDSGIKWSSREYLLTVTVKGTTTNGAAPSISGAIQYSWIHYNVEKVEVNSRDSGEKDWGTGTIIEASGTSGDMEYTLPEADETDKNNAKASFTNRKADQVNIQVKKEWGTGDATQDAKGKVTGVTVELHQKVKGTDTDTVYETVSLNEGNQWQKKWEKLLLKTTDRSGKTTEYEYELIEKDITFEDGSGLRFEQFLSEGVWKQDTGEWKIYTITNTHVDDLPYNLTLTKVMGDEEGNMADPDNPSYLEGAVFKLYRMDEGAQEGTLLAFRQDGDGSYIYEGSASENTDTATTDGSDGGTGDGSGQKATVTELTTGRDGKIVVKKLPKGTYQFEEAQAPAGFVAVSREDLKPVTLSAATAEEYKQDVAYSEKPVVDALYSYRLPESGGIGTTIFYVTGGSLIAVAGLLLIVRRRLMKRR